MNTKEICEKYDIIQRQAFEIALKMSKKSAHGVTSFSITAVGVGLRVDIEFAKIGMRSELVGWDKFTDEETNDFITWQQMEEIWKIQSLIDDAKKRKLCFCLLFEKNNDLAYIYEQDFKKSVKLGYKFKEIRTFTMDEANDFLSNGGVFVEVGL